MFPVRWGMSWPQQRAPSIFSWSLCALCPSCLVDWVHLTRALLAQKPQHLGMGNPWCAVSQLCLCWMDCSGEGCGMEPSPGSGANNCTSQSEGMSTNGRGRIVRLAFGDYTSFFTNKKLISCIRSGINIAMISSNLLIACS